MNHLFQFPTLLILVSVSLIPTIHAYQAPSGYELQPKRFTVNSTLDEADQKAGDGKCYSTSGYCTLRAAIMEANATTVSDIISVPVGTYKLTIGNGENEEQTEVGDLDISNKMTILGEHIPRSSAETIIDATGLKQRIFDLISDSADLTLKMVTLSDGEDDSGGAIRQRKGSLTLDHVTITDNTAYFGGGIYIDSSAKDTLITHSKIYSNAADEYQFSKGGGIYSTNAHLTIDYSSISENNVYSTSAEGGGVYYSSQEGDRLIIRNSTISSNKCHILASAYNASYGAGLYISGNLTAEITNSSIYKNFLVSPGDGEGAGIFGAGPSATISINNSTISENDARENGRGGGLSITSATFTLQNTIVAENIAGKGAPDCFDYDPDTINVISLGYNLIGNATDCDFTASEGDQVGDSNNVIDPMLAALASNGGPTQTYALEEDSPARDAGNPEGCTDANGAVLAYDQRGEGYPRTMDSNGDGIAICDIGAYEAQE